MCIVEMTLCYSRLKNPPDFTNGNRNLRGEKCFHFFLAEKEPHKTHFVQAHRIHGTGIFAHMNG